MLHYLILQVLWHQPFLSLEICLIRICNCYGKNRRQYTFKKGLEMLKDDIIVRPADKGRGGGIVILDKEAVV